MSSDDGAGKASRTSGSASVIVAGTTSGYHVLRIDGYSRTKATPTGEYHCSLPFTVGGHRWCIRYYPNGEASELKDYISLYLRLEENLTKKVKAQYQFRFVSDAAEQPLKLGVVNCYGGQTIGWGLPRFISREELEKSKHLQDDSFAVRCDVLVEDIRAEAAMPEDGAVRRPAPAACCVSVPPSDMQRHFGDLLLTEKGADVVFDVGGQTFAAHRCVLAARSPVFSAELLGVMKEGVDGGDAVRIQDMEAKVFKALLYFVYTDLFPTAVKEDEEKGGEDQDEEDAMAQHLLVAADRYNLERLKLICEEKLCKDVDVGTVTTILALAEQHQCRGLKKACMDFLSAPANLRAVVASDGFKHLSRSCPSVMEELVAICSGK